MTDPGFVLATRRSALALAQSRRMARALEAAVPGLAVQELHVVTEGDRVQDRPLAAIGGKGLFVKEIEEALLDGRARLAVHSMKDLPVSLAPGLVIAATPRRASPWDLLVTRDGRALGALSDGATVGTSSQRRALQLRAVRPDLNITLLRGNVDTRLRKLEEGQYDAIVLAEAGLERLGLAPPGVRLEGVLTPSVAQGVLALECRADDADACAWVGRLDDPQTRLEVSAERAVMAALGASCTVPMGAYARRVGDALRVEGFYARDDGSASVRAELEGPARSLEDARALGERLAATLAARLG
ncbi:MAG: hydroxymethylbilane synthase [Myxococcales bacterium]|nr:hydroxymethylbilane synthase [Myxococcales bacterium]